MIVQHVLNLLLLLLLSGGIALLLEPASPTSTCCSGAVDAHRRHATSLRRQGLRCARRILQRLLCRRRSRREVGQRGELRCERGVHLRKLLLQAIAGHTVQGQARRVRA